MMASMDGWMDPHLYLGLLLHLVALIRQWFYIKLAINSIFHFDSRDHVVDSSPILVLHQHDEVSGAWFSMGWRTDRINLTWKTQA
jgi:hypothetical protein